MCLFAIVFILNMILLVSEMKAVSNEAQYNNYMEVLKNCSSENGVTVEAYVRESRRSANNKNSKTNCVDACIFKIYKILKQDGSIDVEKATEHLLTGRPGIERDIMLKNIQLCSRKKEETDCDTAHRLMNCVLGTH